MKSRHLQFFEVLRNSINFPSLNRFYTFSKEEPNPGQENTNVSLAREHVHEYWRFNY